MNQSSVKTTTKLLLEISSTRGRRAAQAVRQRLEKLFLPESLEKYGDFGYLLLFFPLLLLNLILLRVGLQMQQVLKNLPLWGNLLVSIIFETIPLPTEEERKLTLIQLLLILYLMIGLNPFSRRKIGEVFADFCYWMYEGIITAAGWCIRHRWWSFLLVLMLFVGLVFQINSYADQIASYHVREENFDRWVASTERITTESTIDGSEADRFLELMSTWDPRFKQVLTHNQLFLAEHLHDFVIVLYKDYNPRQPWLRHMLAHREDLKKIYDEAAFVQVDKQDRRSMRMLNLMHLTMARIHVRLGRDDCSDLDMILEAHIFLNKVVPEVAETSFVRTISNVKGNVYNCLLTELLEDGRPERRGDSYGRLLKICKSHLACLEEALDAYQAAAEGAQPCDFAWRRKLNNEIDVKAKLALRFATLPSAEDGEKPPLWLQTSERLARELGSRAGELLECNRSEPFVPLVFVTAAQAFGASAGLWPTHSLQRSADLRAAGALLRLSSSYKPRDIDDWNLVFFCPALQENHIDADFAAGMNVFHNLGSIDVARLERSIRKRCRR